MSGVEASMVCWWTGLRGYGGPDLMGPTVERTPAAETITFRPTPLHGSSSLLLVGLCVVLLRPYLPVVLSRSIHSFSRFRRRWGSFSI